MADDLKYRLEHCLVLNVVRAARQLTRKYDAVLRGHGVTVAQFALLAAVRSNPGLSVRALAPRIGMERTALSRNLTLLEGRGLVVRDMADASARICRLTADGDALLEQVLPEWIRVQDEMRRALGADNATQFLAMLDTLSQQ